MLQNEYTPQQIRKLRKKLTDKEFEQLEMLSDAVKWAEATLRSPGNPDIPLDLRDYQEEMLQDPSIRKVSRCGRRVGKTITMVVHILWYAFNNRNSKQVVAAPYKSQIELIFKMIEDFMDSSPAVDASKSRSVKSPYRTIELKNGATISGFTAGSRSGGEGSSLRGQAADWIYMDEVDYMSDADFEAIYAISLEAPERIGVWISSTPTGRRGKFYDACQSDSWREFHYASTVSPEWSEEMEAELRTLFSGEAYKHEVLAEFGEETIGVFPKEQIEKAQGDYHYATMPSEPRVCFIGADWDKYHAETQIVVFSYNFRREKFEVRDRISIPKGDFTLDNGVKKILELNKRYNPEGIYVDRGYGEYQVETLKRIGIENPETGLKEKVRGVSYSEKIKVDDPTTRTKIKKDIKPFLVGQLQILFEQGRVRISKHDEMIIRQLENYRVVKRTSTGRLIFTSEDEHALDCMMNALLGFIEKRPKIMEHMYKRSVSSEAANIAIKRRNNLQENVLKSEDRNIGKSQVEEWDEPGSPPPKIISGRSARFGKSAGWSSRGTNTSRRHKRKRF